MQISIVGLSSNLGIRILFELAQVTQKYCDNDTFVVGFDAFRNEQSCKQELYSLLSDDKERGFGGFNVREFELAAFNRIRFASSLKEAVENADFVIEAITEQLEIKQTLFAEMETFIKKKTTCVFSTNTLTLRLEEIGSKLKEKTRLLGLRFLYPVTFLNIVEVTTTMGNSHYYDLLIDFIYNVLKKVPMVYDLSPLLEGESEAEALAIRRNRPINETLKARIERMESIGAKRYRISDENYEKYASIEKKRRWLSLPASTTQQQLFPWIFEDNTCVICLEALTPTNHVILPNCLHKFHQNCLNGNNMALAGCPICRSNFMPASVFTLPPNTNNKKNNNS